MQPILIEPESEQHWLELRKTDITSTEVAALFDESPYLTHAELWYAKKDQIDLSIGENERTLWGKRLQNAIALGIAADKQWAVEPFTAYARREDLRIGASFDFKGRDDKPDPFVFEIKNVDGLAFKNGWSETEFGLEAPAHIEIQLQHQLLVLGWKRGVVGPLIGGNRTYVLEREYYPETGEAILVAVANFWASVAANEPPPLDFARDLSLIVKLSQEVSKGKVLEASDRMAELARIYQSANDTIRLAEKDKDTAKGELLTLIGDAEKVLGSGFSISAPKCHRDAYSVEACDYRMLRVNFKKTKGKSDE